MKLKQKRKYSVFFTFAVFLLLISIGLSFFVKNNEAVLGFNADKDFVLYLVIWLNFLVLNIVYFQASKRSYFINNEYLIINKPLFFSQKLNHYQITDVRFNPNDHVFFIFGSLPSVKIVYDCGKKQKKVYIRVNKPELLYKIVEHESRIGRLKNPEKAFGKVF